MAEPVQGEHEAHEHEHELSFWRKYIFSTLNKPEPLFKVKCDVHPWMNAYVAVMTHPYFAVTGKDGKFSIPNLPDGTYEIEARPSFDKFKPQTASITVSGGAVTKNFTFKRQ